MNLLKRIAQAVRSGQDAEDFPVGGPSLELKKIERKAIEELSAAGFLTALDTESSTREPDEDGIIYTVHNVYRPDVEEEEDIPENSDRILASEFEELMGSLGFTLGTTGGGDFDYQVTIDKHCLMFDYSTYY